MFLAMCCSCCSWFVLGWCSNVIIPDLRLAGVYVTERNMAGLAASSLLTVIICSDSRAALGTETMHFCFLCNLCVNGEQC